MTIDLEFVVLLIGLVVSFCTPLLKLNGSIVRFDTTIKSLQDSLEEQNLRSRETHKDLYNRTEANTNGLMALSSKVDSHDKILQQHTDTLQSIVKGAQPNGNS